MRILLITGIFPPDVGGPATYVEKLAEEFVKRGHQVAVATFADENFTSNTKSFPVFKIFRKRSRTWRYLAYFWLIWRLSGDFDVLYCQGPSLAVGLPCFLASFLRSKPYVIKVVGDPSWEYARNHNLTNLTIDEFQIYRYRKSIIKIMRWLQGVICRRAMAVIVPSNYLKSIVGRWGVPIKKIKVIYNAVEVTPPFNPPFKGEASVGFTLLSVGRLVSWKGFGVLIDLMPELLKENKKMRLVILGDGPMKKELDNKIKKLGMEKFIILKGQVSKNEVADYLRAADIFVLNTGYEGLPHIILEAMQAGCPVITTNVGGNLEVIKHNFNGLLVKPNDKNGLKSAILQIFQNKEARYQYIENGHRTLKERFGFEKMIDETERILKIIDSRFRGNDREKRVRDILIVASAHIRRFLGAKTKGKRIICLHNIENRRQFREKMLWLKKNYEVVSLEALLDSRFCGSASWRRQESRNGRRNWNGKRTQVAITFDDGYADWRDNVLPVLKELKIPATFFICSGFVGLPRIPVRKRNFRPLTKEELVELASYSLFEIGAHTANHIDLGKINFRVPRFLESRNDGGDENNKVLEREILGDKKQLEEWTGKLVRWFAYPYGAPKNISQEAKDYIKKAGFQAAFTIISGFIDVGQQSWDSMMTNRDSLDINSPNWLWRVWLSGGYDWFSHVKAKFWR